MANQGSNHAPTRDPTDDLPHGIGQPVRRAQAAAGYTRLEHLTRVGAAELLALHGFGPKALAVLRQALAARGQSFASEGDDRGRGGAPDH